MAKHDMPPSINYESSWIHGVIKHHMNHTIDNYLWSHTRCQMTCTADFPVSGMRACLVSSDWSFMGKLFECAHLKSRCTRMHRQWFILQRLTKMCKVGDTRNVAPKRGNNRRDIFKTSIFYFKFTTSANLPYCTIFTGGFHEACSLNRVGCNAPFS